jgi:hypothetical protein
MENVVRHRRDTRMSVKVYALLIFSLLPLVPGCKSATNNQGSVSSQQTSSSSETKSAPAPAVSPEVNKAGEVANTSPAATKGKVDACQLLTSADIEAVQGEGLKETKRTEQTSGALFVSQCFYATNNFTNSVSLTVTERSSGSTDGGRGPREIWKEQFERTADRGEGRKKEKEREQDKDRGEREEEEEGQPPERVAGVGDEAYWMGGQKVGALYVLKGDTFLRISIGGRDEPEAKIKKMKTLAQQALKRL